MNSLNPHTYNKPDTIDSPIYAKPNTYEEEDTPEYTTSLPPEVMNDIIVRTEFIDGKRPDIKTNEDDEIGELAVESKMITSTLLSHVSATVSSTTLPPSIMSPSVSSTSSVGSNGSNTGVLALLQILNKMPMEDLLSFDLRKKSLSKPFEHDVYFSNTKLMAYKKLQPHSYSWGFQNVLYRNVTLKEGEEDDMIKVAEMGSKAFQKEIHVEWGEYNVRLNQIEEEENKDVVVDPTKVFNSKFQNTAGRVLFRYDSEIEDYKVRWRRVSMASRDIVCSIKKKSKDEILHPSYKKWRVIAQFDSHAKGYLMYMGKLDIDKNALLLVERPDYLESHIIITCCTLIDLMRESVENVIGIGRSGVVGSV